MAWNANCGVKYTKVKDNSLQSSKNYFEAHKLIDKIGNILDLSKFRDAAKWIKDKANEKGYFPDLLIYDIQNGKKVAYNIPAFKKLDGINAQIEKNKSKYGNQGELFQKESKEGIIASEKTIRDLAARMSDRIGIPVKFESDRSKKYKGKLENGVAVINLAYATLDTIFHEIAGHSIIRALKIKSEKTTESYLQDMIDKGIITKEC